jgi:hypothetical protein
MRVLLPLLLAAAAAGSAEVFNDKIAALEPFERDVGRGKTLVLKGVLKGAYRNPELILIAPKGQTYLNKDNDVSGARFVFTVRFEEGTGPYRLEIIAHAPDATRTAARFTIHHGQKAPPVEAERPPPPAPRTPPAIHERLLEKRFLRLLNSFRAEIGCDPVGWNEAVAARAREHAVRMAAAERRQHRFGGTGVLEMLGKDGAGPTGLSGPATPWVRTSSERPFDRPAPQAPGPRVWNRVVVMNVAGDSLEGVFDQHFVREAAFRICAADPHCVEVGVGAARPAAPPPPPKTSPNQRTTTAPKPWLAYYCVCFVQVNEKPLIAAQDDAFSSLLRAAQGHDPELLRTLAIWGRPEEALGPLERACKDEKADVVAAAFDGLLLLDEDKARAGLAEITKRCEETLAAGRYAEAIALAEPLRAVRYDTRIAAIRDRLVRDATTAARKEVRALGARPPAERAAAARELKARAQGLGLDAAIDKAVG